MAKRKGLLLVIMSFFFILISGHSSETAKFNQVFESSLPDNDLWKEDCKNCRGGITEEQFSKIIDAAYDIYLPLADKNNEQLVINKNWDDSTVNANCSRWMGKVEINMFGGLARRQETTAEGFTLVLCHELSHAYGGIPYISAFNKMSAEGQADYMGTKECAKQVFKALNLEQGMEPTDFMQKTCNDNEICISSLIGGQSLGNLLATIKNESAPSYETPDPTVVKKTLLSYPATVQCRLDTYLSGTLNKNRPLCWYKP